MAAKRQIHVKLNRRGKMVYLGAALMDLLALCPKACTSKPRAALM